MDNNDVPRDWAGRPKVQIAGLKRTFSPPPVLRMPPGSDDVLIHVPASYRDGNGHARVKPADVSGMSRDRHDEVDGNR